MAYLDGQRAQFSIQHVTWLMMCLGCRFDLPDVSGDDGPPQFSNCIGLPTTCGTNEDESCCHAQQIPGGIFNRSNDNAYPATVSSFVLDTYEVTVGRFRAFVNAGLGTQSSGDWPIADTGAHPRLSRSGWNVAWAINLPVDSTALMTQLKCSDSAQTWTDSPGSNENKPINCVTWYMAMAFCIWDGGYLPTEAEWNYAASGGDEQRTYPWSNPANSTTIGCEHANYKINNPMGMHCVNGTTGGLSSVGSEALHGKGKWMSSGMAGNVWEWTLDGSGAYQMPCNDCARLDPASERIIRGGSFVDEDSMLHTAVRVGFSPTTRYPNFGFRCARAP
jgi:formylglycine-generating enzyme required for sulfatase activity